MEEFLGLGEGGGGGGGGGSGGHFGEFEDAGFALHDGYCRDGFVFGLGFFDGEVAVGEGGDLGEVGDAEDLVDAGEGAELFADDGAHAAADVGVDFVEDEDGDAVGLGEDGFEGEHDAGEFAAGGDAAEGTGRLAGVGGDEEFDGFEAGGGGEVLRGEGEGKGEETIGVSKMLRVRCCYRGIGIRPGISLPSCRGRRVGRGREG